MKVYDVGVIRRLGGLVLVDFKKAKSKYCIGCFTIFFVVFIIAALATVLSKVPIVFLRLSELDHGEIDLLITPNYLERRLNWTWMYSPDSPTDLCGTRCFQAHCGTSTHYIIFHRP
eukprot:TRINITY_DN13674_c0_g2_i11.p1 TRINITY_DN13674_c0_g2~~TRINITY_DN13674_c0_g2_i11.p1  ORF type:complete len:132 (+),score=20.64 TRINITY_DN13674_c0_g2_i11:51-398(+)